MTRTAVIPGASRASAGRWPAPSPNGWRLVVDARSEDELEAARAELAQRTVVLAVAGDEAAQAHAAIEARATIGKTLLLA